MTKRKCSAFVQDFTKKYMNIFYFVNTKYNYKIDTYKFKR
jgi:hypothetical protein